METTNRQEVFEKIFKEHLKIETYSKSIEGLFSPGLKIKLIIPHIIKEITSGTTIKQHILLKAY